MGLLVTVVGFMALLCCGLAGFAPLHVDCGALTSYTDSAGIKWVPDTSYHVGGSVFSNSSVSNKLAKTQRWWLSSSLTSTSGEAVSTGMNGLFTVTVYLAENFFSAPHRRLFNVKVNGIKLFSSDVDLYSKYGLGKLVSVPIDVWVTTGKISITVTASLNNPTLAAFTVVYKSSTRGPTISPTKVPTAAPTKVPTAAPTKVPIAAPTKVPTAAPTKVPTAAPTAVPTAVPTKIPTLTPNTNVPSSKIPTPSPTLATKAPSPLSTSGPTWGPTPAPDALCKKVLAYDDFSSGSLNPAFFTTVSCNDSIYTNTTSAGQKALTMKLPAQCNSTTVMSTNFYHGGYFETVMRLGGQGPSFNGLVYAWYLRECLSGCAQSNEIDFEWLGYGSDPSLYQGYTQSNWFYNGVGAGMHEKLHVGPASPYNNFFKLGIYWDNTTINWYINGIMARSEVFATTQVSTARQMRLILSIWNGSKIPYWCGTLDRNSPQSDNYLMQFKYLKVCS